MADPDAFTKLGAFPRDVVIERELFACHISEVDLLAALGAPTSESQPPLGEGNPFFYWDLEWSCGLVTGLQFDQIAQRLVGYLDEPDVDHALRHLGLEDRDVWLLERAAPDTWDGLVEPPDRSHEVYRLDRVGQRIRLVGGLTRRDAHCYMAELRAAGETDLYVRAGATVGPATSASRPGADRVRTSPDDEVPVPTEPAGERETHLAQALVARAAGSLGRAGEDEVRTPARVPSAPVLPDSFDPGQGEQAIESFEDEIFSDDALLSTLADAAASAASPSEAPALDGQATGPDDDAGAAPPLERRLRPSELMRRDLRGR